MSSVVVRIVAPILATALLVPIGSQAANAQTPDSGANAPVQTIYETGGGITPVNEETELDPAGPPTDPESAEIAGMTDAEVIAMLSQGSVNSDYYPKGSITEEAMRESGPKLRYKFYDSNWPTYNYVRIWFNKRATYLIGAGSFAVGTLSATLGGFIPNVYARAAAAVLTLGSAVTTLLARNAQNDGQCIAYSFYIRKLRYYGMNLRGPEVAPRSMYQTSTNCTGRYSRS